MAIVLSGTASTGNDTADALAATYPPSLFGLPGDKPVTGDQVLKAYQYIAESGSPIWGTIRKGLLDAGQYGKLSAKQKADVSAYNWTKSDKAGLTEAITNFHIYNKQAPAPVPFTQFITQQKSSVKTNGVSGSKALTPIVIPSTPDLNKSAIDGFVAVTGRNPTPDEEASFTKQFQDLAMQYAVGKQSAKNQQVFAQPTPDTLANPTQTQAQLPTPPAGTSALQQLPDPNVAAQNFARNTNPVAAASHGMSDAIDQWLGSLAKGTPGQ